MQIIAQTITTIHQNSLVTKSNEVLLRFLNHLMWRGERASGFEFEDNYSANFVSRSSTGIYAASRFRVSIGAPSSDTNVAGGSKDSTRCSQDFSVTRVVSNSRFSRVTNENDIALLTLDSDIDFSKECVCPICMSSRVPAIGEMCTVSGWVAPGSKIL